MDENRVNRKQFLLRQNQGRHEISNMLQHLNKASITKFTVIDLNISDRIIESMMKKEVLKESFEMSLEKFKDVVDAILSSETSRINYLWTTKSEYCGLLKLTEMPDAETIISLLNDTYFDGYLTLYFLGSKNRLDIDIDENPQHNNQWYYSYKYSKVSDNK